MSRLAGVAPARCGHVHARAEDGAVVEHGEGHVEHVVARVPGGVVTAQVKFPDCWDGTIGYDPITHTYPGFDTPTGIAPSHFSYSVNGVCPAGTVPCVPGTMMAQLVTQQTFIDPRTNAPMVNPNNADGTLGLSFSSGPYYTYHADYINTWSHVLGDIVQACLNHAPCGTSVNGIPIQ